MQSATILPKQPSTVGHAAASDQIQEEAISP